MDFMILSQYWLAACHIEAKNSAVRGTTSDILRYVEAYPLLLDSSIGI